MYVLFALLNIVLPLSCVAPISFQALTRVWPSMRNYWRALLSLVIMVLVGGLAWLVFPAFEGYYGMFVLYTLVVLVYVFGIMATMRTAWQLFRSKQDDGFRSVRVLASMVLVGYSILLLIGLYVIVSMVILAQGDQR
jgi:hypothetical protein